MSLLIVSHVLLGVIGVFIGVILMVGKPGYDKGTRQEAENDEKLADFHTLHVSSGLGSTAPATKEGMRQRNAA
jgi:hypothetical protein